MSQDLIAKLKFNDQGLIPAVVQDAVDGEVLMVAYMDREAVEKSLATGKAWFYSRSRQKLWLKGETSGHIQEIKEIYYDCDADTLLLKVNQTGGACHEGYRSCFYRQLVDDAVSAERVFQPEQIYASLGKIMAEVFGVIQDRKITRPEGSYTAYLFDKGLDKILKKVGEETAEVIIAAKNNKEELVYETADLLYHLMVLLAEQDLTLEDIARELAKRR